MCIFNKNVVSIFNFTNSLINIYQFCSVYLCEYTFYFSLTDCGRLLILSHYYYCCCYYFLLLCWCYIGPRYSKKNA